MESEEEDGRTESQKNDTTDFISSLSDCVLTHILSLLPTRDSVRTSILSSRWSPLWKLVPVLHLERLRNQDTVSNIWNHRNAAIPLRKFYLHGTSDCNTAYVDTMLQDTILRGRMLQELDLDIYSHPIPNPPLELHPSLFFSTTLVVLKLGGEILLSPPLDSIFPSLHILYLESGISYANCDSLPTLLAACPLLQELALTVAYKNFENTRMLKIIVLIPTLKILYLSWLFEWWCYPLLHFYILRLNAPALEQFYFHGLLSDDVVLENLPNLVKSGFQFKEIEDGSSRGDYAKRIWDFMRPLYNVVSMEFCIETAQIICEASNYNLPVFNNLTSLTFDGELSCSYYAWPAVQLLLCQAPKLQTLAFELTFTDEFGDYDDYSPESCMKKPLSAPECLSSHLTACYYKGFSGHEVEMELVTQVLEKAEVLKTMKITVESHLDPMRKLQIHEKVRKLQRRSCTCQIEFDEAHFY
ncbi:FBD-associated F-box protein At5g60610-like isoform X1 [Quercus lobata]|uniref:FBD-associated F-box protein At5g60610-like isoform X1 n=1 Tax=Quercus lobata TaxID=97700 RepID=UPI00124864F8|nr:FBD-associated F-box protein At5g60610-like isoform X1 [Quercus lobata]